MSKITVGEWLPRWLALQVQLKPTTMVRYEGILRRQILPRWGVVPLARIRQSDVFRWVINSPPKAWRRHRSAAPTACCPSPSQRPFATDG
jgi:hypothetical protein